MRYRIGISEQVGGPEIGTLAVDRGGYAIMDAYNVDELAMDGSIVPVFTGLDDATVYVNHLNKIFPKQWFFLRKYDTKETLFKIGAFNRNLRTKTKLSVPCYEFKAK